MVAGHGSDSTYSTEDIPRRGGARTPAPVVIGAAAALVLFASLPVVVATVPNPAAAATIPPATLAVLMASGSSTFSSLVDLLPSICSSAVIALAVAWFVAGKWTTASSPSKTSPKEIICHEAPNMETDSDLGSSADVAKVRKLKNNNNKIEDSDSHSADVESHLDDEEDDDDEDDDTPPSTLPGTPSTHRSNPSKSGLTRRQRKNRQRRQEELQSRSASGTPKVQKKRAGPSKHYTRLGMTDDEIYALMLRYTVDPDQLRRLGFPTESELHPGKAYIYRDPEFGCRFEEDHVLGGERPELDEADLLSQNLHTLANTPKLPSTSASSPDLQSQDDVQCQLFPARACESSSRLVLSASAKEFVPGALRHTRRCSQASEEREDAKDVALTPTSCSPGSESKDDYDFPPKRCVRCSQAFYISPAGEYLTQEACVHHWGKLRSRRYKRPAMFSCCGAKAEAKGCVKAEYHVWTGLSSEPGMHGPLDDFVRTRSRSRRSQKIVGAPPPGVSASTNNILSLDGEMAFTPFGLELIKLTVVGLDGRLVYDTLVQPDNFIVDYNTRFSGLCERDLEKGPTKSLREVQNDLMGFVNSNSILIGHGLDNDLRALKLIHSTIIDTSIVFPHYFGLPYRRSLKSLVKSYLKRDIQKADWGHDSFEDALACAELMLWKVRKDLGVKSPHKDSSEQLDPS